MAGRAPRIHAGSWWLVAIALIAIASTAGLTVLLLQVLLLAGLGLLIRNGSPMANSARVYVLLAIAVLVTRVIFRIIFNYETPSTAGNSSMLLGLPRLELYLGPLGSIKLFGQISTLTMASALTDGLRLAAIILSAGLANTLASPKRLISSIPGSLYDLAIAISIAINIAPAIIAGFERVRRVQALRSASKNKNLISRVLIPVLEDALSQSFQLAASMANRGFGHREPKPQASQRYFRAFMSLALLLLGGSAWFWLFSAQTLVAASALFGGVLCAFLAVRASSAGQKRTRVRPQSFGWPDWFIATGSLLATVAATIGWLN